MWDFMKLAPVKLLAISKTLTGASFGFGLSKLFVTASMASMITILTFFPDNWEMVGGRNVPLGGSAQEIVDAGMFLANISSFDDIDLAQFNLAFGQVIKKREDGLYDFSVEKANNKDQFHFDLNILARVFGEKLGILNLNGCGSMKGA